MHIVAMHTIAIHGTRVGTNVQLTFVIRVGTNVQLTFAIHEQLTYKSMLNSVHNCESHTRNALINSHINYQGNGLIMHI